MGSREARSECSKRGFAGIPLRAQASTCAAVEYGERSATLSEHQRLGLRKASGASPCPLHECPDLPVSLAKRSAVTSHLLWRTAWTFLRTRFGTMNLDLLAGKFHRLTG